MVLRLYFPLYVFDQYGDEYVGTPVILEGRLFAKFSDGTLIPVLEAREFRERIRADPESANHQIYLTLSSDGDEDEADQTELNHSQ
ncbi:MAG TPA: hypothetical protein VL134_04610 [Leptolyngbya sp.]|jgi:hypothetical protein|nr:hypothetical protein [Leptolyngbya sp.]